MTVTYEQVSKKRDALEHWVRFIEDISSDQWTDYLRSMFSAGVIAVGIDEENALAILNLVEAEIDRARAEFLDETVEDYASDDPSVREVYSALIETGVRQWPAKSSNADVSAQLGRCGEGTAGSPWNSDELIKLAKMLRVKRF